jgi:hypothetical protein
MKTQALILAIVLTGCWNPVIQDPTTPSPTPPPDTDWCSKMCNHIGPKAKGGLGCEEGNPVYNNDIVGPKDVPNQSCEDNCKELQGKGLFLNPKCIAIVDKCENIETFRQKKPETCVKP